MVHGTEFSVVLAEIVCDDGSRFDVRSECFDRIVDMSEKYKYRSVGIADALVIHNMSHASDWGSITETRSSIIEKQ
ncbi:hypothetical protein C477_17785 [Haloterrigena salina JCM 13891]|uniref:Uncharacterized protein n=1 Tax=Haloterrigena salina JCM 13891 TaxID=1227488 RepID=M0C0X2_9EURY|nr:hypothetical protein C477_17785 [Haloterrigena salina JCM 13891]